jgi:hypothetical protein
MSLPLIETWRIQHPRFYHSPGPSNRAEHAMEGLPKGHTAKRNSVGRPARNPFR